MLRKKTIPAGIIFQLLMNLIPMAKVSNNEAISVTQIFFGSFDVSEAPKPRMRPNAIPDAKEMKLPAFRYPMSPPMRTMKENANESTSMFAAIFKSCKRLYAPSP